jgi:hypothetical protein
MNAGFEGQAHTETNGGRVLPRNGGVPTFICRLTVGIIGRDREKLVCLNEAPIAPASEAMLTVMPGLGLTNRLNF